MLTPHDRRTAAIERARAAAELEAVCAGLVADRVERLLPDLTFISLDQAAELRAQLECVMIHTPEQVYNFTFALAEPASDGWDDMSARQLGDYRVRLFKTLLAAYDSLEADVISHEMDRALYALGFDFTDLP